MTKYCKKCLTKIDENFRDFSNKNILDYQKNSKTFQGEYVWVFCPTCSTPKHLSETIGQKKAREKKLRKLLK